MLKLNECPTVNFLQATISTCNGGVSVRPLPPLPTYIRFQSTPSKQQQQQPEADINAPALPQVSGNRFTKLSEQILGLLLQFKCTGDFYHSTYLRFYAIIDGIGTVSSIVSTDTNR